MQHAQELEILAKKEEKQTNSKRCFEEWVSKKAMLERDRRKMQEQRQSDEAAKEREVRGQSCRIRYYVVEFAFLFLEASVCGFKSEFNV